MGIHPHFDLAFIDRAERRAFHEVFAIEAEHILRYGFYLLGHRFTGDLAHLAEVRRQSISALAEHPDLREPSDANAATAEVFDAAIRAAAVENVGGRL